MRHFLSYLSGAMFLTCTASLLAHNGLTEPLSLKSVQTAGTVIDLTDAITKANRQVATPVQKPRRIAGAEPFELPYLDTFDSDIDGYTVVNSNNDGSTWEWNEEGEGSARYQNCQTNSGDDWLITPCLKLKGGRTYKVIVKASAALTARQERMEAKWGQGKTAEAMTNDLIAPTDIAGRYWRDLEAEFTPTSDGSYNIGFHAISNANNGRLWIGELKIEEVPMKVAPGPVTDLKGTPDPEGALKATISFTAPAEAVDGSAITSLDYIEVRNNNILVGTLKDVVPGKEYSCMDNNAVQGPGNLYTVTAFKDGAPGESAELNLFVGIDTPTVPLLTAIDLGGAVKLTWEPVTGVNGGVVPAADLAFHVFNYQSAYMELITELRNQYEYTVDGVDTEEGDTQSLRYWSVQAVNSAGTSNYGTAALIMGRPYATPYNISFRNATLEDQFVAQSHSATRNYNWGATSYDSQDGDNGCMALTCQTESDGEFHTGKIRLDRTGKSKLSFHYKAENQIPGVIYVTVRHKDGTVSGPLFYKDLSGNDNNEWNRVVVDMPDPKGDDDYVSVYFHADMKAALESNLFFDNISIFKDAKDDADISLKAPESIVLGQNAEIVAEMTNVGVNDIEDARIQVFVNDELVGETAITEKLPTLHKAVLPVTYRTSTVNASEKYNVSAVVIYDKDENADNNKSHMTITATEADVQSPANLEAASGNPVELTWEAPAYEITKTTDDFEGYEAWTTEFGDWTTVDSDGGYAGALNAALVYPHQYEQFAFMAWRPSDYFNANQGIEPHSGEIGLVSIYQFDKQQKNYVGADNWLISPLLSGNGQTISVWVNNSRSGQYGIETFEILTSTTGKDLKNFEVLETHRKSDTGWTEITFDVPEGTRFFAVHHTTAPGNAHLFMLDDITYEGSSAPEAYNVYRDGKLIATVYEPAFSDNLPDPAASYRYEVTAVYNRGHESKPISTIKAELVDTLEEQNTTFNVFTTRGVQLLKDASTLRGLEPGMYIINGEKVYLRR